MKEDKLIGLLRDVKFYKKEKFVIPTPEGGEDEQTYIGRCVSAIYDEYPVEGQAYAICKAKWDE